MLLVPPVLFLLRQLKMFDVEKGQFSALDSKFATTFGQLRNMYFLSLKNVSHKQVRINHTLHLVTI